MYERFLATNRFGCLDGLRAASILAVLWHHSGMVPESGILARGQIGVYLFFAISGFLITTLLIRERQKTGTISMRSFYLRRTLRILPLYYAVLFTYVVLVPIVERGPDGAEFFANLPYFATYTSNWFVSLGEDGRVIFFFAWSLAAEEQFYATWPWVEKYAMPVVRRIALGAVIALVAATHFSLLLWLVPADTLLHTIMWSIAPPILLGVVVAHLLHSKSGFEHVSRVLGHRASAPVVVTALLILLALPATAATNYLVFLALTALVTACVIREDNVLAPILKMPPLVRIGMVSYGMYMMHMLCFNAVNKAGAIIGIRDRWLLWLIGIITVYFVAEISFATFERAFQKLRHGRSRHTTPG